MFNFIKKHKLKSITKNIKKLQAIRQQTELSEAEIKKEIALHYMAAELYRKNIYNKAFAHAEEYEIEDEVEEDALFS